MGIYTNTGLVKHAEKALSLPTKYMWGGILRPIEKQYDMLFRMYGTGAGTGYTAARWDELAKLRGKGYFGVDCIGLIKSYYWSGDPDGGTGSPKYGAAGFPDVNAGFMYKQSKVKGKIGDIPETPGLIVYSKTHPHVGIYIGGGYTIESTLGSRGDGVVRRRLDNFWECFFECPYIEYVRSSSVGVKRPYYPIGCKVRIRDTAKCYSGTSIAIPEKYKAGNAVFTVAKVISERALLQELYSWVDISDIEPA